ncbi:hypothetical protein BDR26DRAFT_851922 [Obelidium mucronatum]|nr:hypothetical protein BDR26DRAFT_851922 [Obelidium mucronatum]
MALDAAVLDAALGTLPLRVRLPLNADLFEDDAKTLEALLSSEQEPLPEKKPASTTPTPTPEYAKLLKTKNVSAQINILPTSSPSSPSEEHNRNTASSILQSSTSSVLPAPSKQHSRKKSPSPSRPPPPIKSKQSGPKKAIEPEDDELDLLLSSDPLPSKSAKSIKMDKPGKQPGKQPTKSAPAKKDESDDLKFLDDLLQ